MSPVSDFLGAPTRPPDDLIPAVDARLAEVGERGGVYHLHELGPGKCADCGRRVSESKSIRRYARFDSPQVTLLWSTCSKCEEGRGGDER